MYITRQYCTFPKLNLANEYIIEIEMALEINWILPTHMEYVGILKQYMTSVVVNYVEEYKHGFVHLGKLASNTIIMRSFTEAAYISFQIKYINNLYFFDFWHVDYCDWSGDFYTKKWTISHYNYIYKNGILLRDKTVFSIDSYEGDITYCFPSYPIYDIKKLKQEEFVKFQCPQTWVRDLNNISLTESHSQENIHMLFKLFSDLTETESDEFYRNSHVFSLSHF